MIFYETNPDGSAKLMYWERESGGLWRAEEVIGALNNGLGWAGLFFRPTGEPVILLDRGAVFSRASGTWTALSVSGEPYFPTAGMAAMGPDGSLHVLHTKYWNPALYYAYLPTSSVSWQSTSISIDAGRPSFVFAFQPRFLSMVVDANNKVHATYVPEFGWAYSELWYLTNKNGSWESIKIYAPPAGSNGDAGLGASIALQPNGQPAIASTYISRVTTGSSITATLLMHEMAANGTWSSSVVSGSPDGYVAGDGPEGTGVAPHLLYDNQGRPHIAFTDYASQHFDGAQDAFGGNLRHAWRDGATWRFTTFFRQNDPIRNQLFCPNLLLVGTHVAILGQVSKDILDSDFNIVLRSMGLTFTESADFILAAPKTVSVPRGGAATATITSTVYGGFSAPVALTATGLPAGITHTLSPTSFAVPGAGSSTLTLSAGAATPLGTYPVTVTGTGGGLTTTKTFTVTVYIPDFTLTVPSTVTAPQGGAVTATISTSATVGLDAMVALTATGLPSGAAFTFNPPAIAVPGTGSSTLTLTAGAATTPGTYPVTVTGTGGGKTHTAIISFTITDSILFNDGFETGGWSLPSGPSSAWSILENIGLAPHSGAKMANFYSYILDSANQLRLYRTDGTYIPKAIKSATLRFWIYHDQYYDNTDRVQVQLSTDGTAWTDIGSPINRYDGTTGWSQTSIDVSAYQGQTLWVGFVGISASGLGIFLDDVVLTAQVIPQYALTTSIVGNGAINNIQPKSPSFSCSSPSTSCTDIFPASTSFTLRATPSSLFDFTVWSGGGCGIGDCQITLNSDITVTATFKAQQLVQLVGNTTQYLSLANAYGNATGGSILKLRNVVLNGDIHLNKAIAVSLLGGFTAGFTTIDGHTTLQGTVSIEKGSAIIDRVIIK
jgi:hypothetical protein